MFTLWHCVFPAWIPQAAGTQGGKWQSDTSPVARRQLERRLNPRQGWGWDLDGISQDFQQALTSQRLLCGSIMVSIPSVLPRSRLCWPVSVVSLFKLRWKTLERFRLFSVIKPATDLKTKLNLKPFSSHSWLMISLLRVKLCSGDAAVVF